MIRNATYSPTNYILDINIQLKITFKFQQLYTVNIENRKEKAGLDQQSLVSILQIELFGQQMNHSLNFPRTRIFRNASIQN